VGGCFPYAYNIAHLPYGFNNNSTKRKFLTEPQTRHPLPCPAMVCGWVVKHDIPQKSGGCDVVFTICGEYCLRMDRINLKCSLCFLHIWGRFRFKRIPHKWGKIRHPKQGSAETFFFFIWEEWSTLQVHFLKVNPQIVINIDFDFVLECVRLYREIFCMLIFQIIHKYFPVTWIYDPIFPDSCIQIKVQFPHIVMFRVAGGDNLNDPVRRAGAASVCKLLRGAYDAYIRLNRIIPVYRAV